MTTSIPLATLLRVNAATSALSGLLCVVATDRLARVLGVADAPTFVVGCGLLVFAADVALVSFARDDRRRRLARVIGWADAAWVAASVALIAAGAFSVTGAIVVAAAAAVVGAFAAVEFAQSSSSNRSATAMMSPFSK